MVYQLKITLLDVKKPPVWRRVLIDADITFEVLHQIIQDAMGWENTHLFSFGYKAYDSSCNIAIPNPYDWDPPTANASKTKVSKYLNQKHHRMKYVYDFGDDWIHDVVLENVFEKPEVGQKLPTCIAAKGACPPEDCGGTWGYEDLKLLVTKKNPSQEEQERLDWFGIDDDFDPKGVDIEDINMRLKILQQKYTNKHKIDPNKQSERVALLRKLILDFSKKKSGYEKIADRAYHIINMLIDNNVNLASGSPERWVAAILIYSKEDILTDIVSRDDIYAYFGVKASGVQNRINTIYDTLCDEDDFCGWDFDGDYEENDVLDDSDKDPIDWLISEYIAGNIKLPPDLENMMKKMGLI